MGGNGDRAKISNAVVGHGGVAGIKIKGDNIHVNIAEHENTSSVTPFDPTKVDVDNAVVGGFGVAGLDIEGNGIDFNIGRDKPETTTTAEGAKPEINPAEEVNPNTTTGAGVTPEPGLLPQYGPVHVQHVPGPSIAFSDNGFEIICAGCGYEAGKHWFSDSRDVILQNIRKGSHVKGSTVLEQPNVKPLSNAVEAPFGIVTGKSIKLIDPSGHGFDIICPTCAVNLGMGLDLIQINAIFQGKHVHDKTVNTATNTAIKLDYGNGPLYISHTQTTSVWGDRIICPGCSYDYGRRASDPTSVSLFNSIINQGLHVQDLKLLEQENVKPLPSPIKHGGVGVTSPNIRPRASPITHASFDVICCGCAWGLAYNGNKVLAYNNIIKGQHVHTDV